VSQEMSTRLESMLRDSQSLARNPGPKSSVARAKLEVTVAADDANRVRYDAAILLANRHVVVDEHFVR